MNSVRNFLCTILLCLCLSPLIHAQALFSRDAEDLQTAAAATGNGTALIVRGWGGAIIQVTGTFSATLTIEGTVDGTNWVTLRVMNVSDGNFVTSVTATGVYAIATAGIETIRARVSAYTSGSVTVKGRGSVAVIARSSGGGSSSLTPGTTAITGGTIGRVFFHDTGDVMGEYPVTGTAGNAVLSISPNLTGAPTITSTSNACFAVGPNPATTPTLSVNCSVSSEVTGLLVAGAATGTNGTLSVTSTGTNDGWNFKSKGTGIFRFVPDTAGAGTVVVGGTADTADAQLSVYSQSATRPGLKLRALSGTATSQNVFESYDAGGALSLRFTAAGDAISTGTTITTASGGVWGKPSAVELSAGGHLRWDTTSSRIYSSADGMLELYNAATTGFTRLNFGGTTNAFGSVARDGAGIKIVGADGTSVGWIKVPGVTVASLPAAATAGAGARSFVTDALTPVFGSAVTGGGAVNVPVYSDGANWIVG